MCWCFRACETEAERLSSGAENNAGSLWAGLQSFPHGRRSGGGSHIWCKSPSFTLTASSKRPQRYREMTPGYEWMRLTPSLWQCVTVPFYFSLNSVSFFLLCHDFSLLFHQVAQYIKFEMPVLQSFITKLKEEEDREVQKLRRRYKKIYNPQTVIHHS